MTAADLIQTCSDVGLRIEPFNERLLVVDTLHDPPFVPEDLFRLLVVYRDEIRTRLSIGHLCKQVLLGEFDTCDGVFRQKLSGLLRCFTHPLTQAAIERLEATRL